MPERRIPPISELYEKILERSSLPLPGFEAKANMAAIRRAGRIHDYLKERAERQKTRDRALGLEKDLAPLFQHPDLYVYFSHMGFYDPDSDIAYVNVYPRCPVNWASTAYRFAKQPGMKYDRRMMPYGVDGQPRVSSDGRVWVRYMGDFEDGSRVGLHIWSWQSSHQEAEEQLARLYGLFMERDGLEPVEVFRKYMFDG
jgi:hypothetical protein